VNGPIPFNEQNYANLRAVSVFSCDIPTNTATILIFLYVIYILGHGVHFALAFSTYVLAPSFRYPVKRNVFLFNLLSDIRK